ncbi:MAG: prepilin-type N-terminal cleavage/methylation domain-containing protein [Planctomycetia bacterium]|nr:prepilin-type N-terminal cleavage/methylation domain-containing protein [Planctomycetia bacterium]
MNTAHFPMHGQRRPRRRRSARGFTLLECVVAAGMLMVVMGLAAQLFAWDARERREVWRRQVAQQEAANLMEQLTAQMPSELTAETLEALRISTESSAWLPHGTLQATATEVTAPAAGRRIELQITWEHASGEPAAPVRLVGWVFGPGGNP